MRIWKITAVIALAFSSFAADNVAPTKTELEEMYNKAFREFEANNFSQALKELDAIDARQPDLAASQNLRGVILMRQGIYDKAEAALLEANRIDPKFWNARFNLAEIPFLQKNWAEARNRFQKLLSSSQSDLASEATQLIQYKILLTYLLEGKENMVDSILAKLELSSDTPAVDYVKAAVALQHKNEKEGKDWIAVAEKNFSPQLNKLFVESFYETGWVERPSGEGRASMPLMTAGERKEKAKAIARAKFEQAQQALRQRDLAAARKVINEADQAEPNQPATLNLRGEILMAQQEFDQAETAFKKAAKLDPKFREAQYNLAQVPFKKKDYAKARERFEGLFERTPGGDKNQAAELIKFKIYMTLLLEGKESRAQSMMEQFQFTGDTPALYYAQAAWEFKHNNQEKAADWVASAKKIYSQPLNNIFADALYDVGWMQAPEVASAAAFDAGSLVASQTDSGGAPAVEPSPIPDSVAAANKQGETAKAETIASSGSVADPVATRSQGLEAQAAVSTSHEPLTGETSDQPAQTSSPIQSAGAGASPAQTAAAASSVSTAKATQGTKPSQTAVSRALANTIAAASRIGVAGLKVASPRTWLVGGLLLVGIFLLAWVLVPGLSRRYTFDVSDRWQAKSFLTPPSLKPAAAAPETGAAPGNGFFGGPRQISARLTASSPFSGSGSHELAAAGSAFHRRVGPLDGDSVGRTYRLNTPDALPTTPEFETRPAALMEKSTPLSSVADVGATAAMEAAAAAAARKEPLAQEQAIAQVPPPTEEASALPPAAQAAVTEPAEQPQFEAIDQGQPIAQVPEPAEKPSELSEVAEGTVAPAIESNVEPQFEPTDQGRFVADQMPISAMQPPAVAGVAVVASYSPDISNAPVSSQAPTSLTMPEQSEQFQRGEVPLAGEAPLPVSAAHTPVQLTFSFEIVSVRLTPTFKVHTLQVRPASKIVTMRLASSQRSEPRTHPQVAFEIVKIQPADSGLGTVQLIKSSRQPQELAQQSVDIALPSFEVTGLQPISGSDSVAGLQLAPSEQGKARVQVTADFQMAKVEFSTSFEITGVVLNPASRQVSVELAGAGPGVVEQAPVFDVANVRLTASGDSELLELHAV